MRHLAFFLGVCLTSSATFGQVAIVPGEGDFKGIGTDARFPMEVVIEHSDKKVTLSALGSGVRKKLVFKGYECVAYAEKGAELDGEFARRIRMYFLRNLGAARIRGSLRGGFRSVLDGAEPDPDLARDFERFLGFIADIKNGQSVDMIWLPGDGLFTIVAGKVSPPIQSPELASTLWAMWLGERPFSEQLKKEMLRFVSDGS